MIERFDGYYTNVRKNILGNAVVDKSIFRASQKPCRRCEAVAKQSHLILALEFLSSSFTSFTCWINYRFSKYHEMIYWNQGLDQVYWHSIECWVFPNLARGNAFNRRLRTKFTVLTFQYSDSFAFSFFTCT